MKESAMTFDCAGEQLVAIISEPQAKTRLGVIVVVGGPQYRVGSHRQFVLLARRLANDGIPVMRFDFRGMGDSSGATQTFEDIIPDIAAAINAFVAAHPSLDRIVLWGLCDAASAALLYCAATGDARVAGIVLLNPWIRSEKSLATTHIKHYYAQRLLDRDFWRKLSRGAVDIAGALRSLAQTILAARSKQQGEVSGGQAAFQDRMAISMERFAGPILIILSGRDLTAKEFLEYTKATPRWNGLTMRSNIERRDLPHADHTFSSAAWRHDVEAHTLDWLKRSFPAEWQ
jgi:exosortase A-associated hydrolase 1